VLDFYLHNVNSLPAGANPSPVMPSGIVAGGGSYQTYGMYSVRMKVEYDDANRLDDYHIAFLLWPKDGTAWASAESDFPEMTLNSGQVCAFAHYGPSTGNGSTKDAYCRNIDITQWHTFTQKWRPGSRSYYIDGQLIGTSKNQVWSGPERWQLQTEPSGTNDGDSGHVLVDWVTVYSRA
jgi:beta-glucanase (GH16 family)